MTYRNSLQGRFVATGYPAAGMLFVSIFLWIVGAVLGSYGCSTLSVFGQVSDAVGRVLSFAAYGIVALVLNNIYLFERRVAWLPLVFFWLTAVQPLVQSDCVTAFSLLLFVLSVAQLFVCCRETGHERAIFGAFALLATSSLLYVQFLLLLPLFVVYMFISHMATVRNFMSAFLGVLTPCWLVAGLIYLFPALMGVIIPSDSSFAAMVPSFAASELPLSYYAALIPELLVWVVAVYIFVASSYPAKPLLRRRILFLMLLNMYLFVLSFVLPGCGLLLLTWRLPGFAVLASYTFSTKVTKVSNIYFVSLNVAWLLIALLCLWIG